VIFYEEIPDAGHAYFGFESASTEFLQMLQGQLEYAKPEKVSSTGVLIFIIIAAIVTLVAAIFLIFYFVRRDKVSPADKSAGKV